MGVAERSVPVGLGWSACDGPLREWVLRVVDGIDATLGAQRVGTYLHGSLASGSFYPPKSDVDLLVVVRSPLTPRERRSFGLLCASLHEARPIVGGLECSVVLEQVTLQARHPMPSEAHFSESSAVEDTDHDAPHEANPDLITHCQAILEGGIRMRGSPIRDVFGPVDPAAFRDSISGDVDWILEDENIVETPFYGVLNLCRALWVWSAESPRLAPSKDEAGEWALERLPPPHADMVVEALRAYRDPEPLAPADRKTAGREWDRRPLLAFRDYFRDVRRKRPTTSVP